MLNFNKRKTTTAPRAAAEDDEPAQTIILSTKLPGRSLTRITLSNSYNWY